MEKEIVDVLNKLLAGQERLESDVKDLTGGLEILKSDVKDLKDGQSKMFDILQGIDAKKSTDHLEILNTLNEIKHDLVKVKNDIDFIGHKEYETEKEVFNIKKHLEIVK